jgi:cell division protein FtsB
MSSRLVMVKNELHDLLEQEADMTRELDKLRERIRQTRLEISRMGGQGF